VIGIALLLQLAAAEPSDSVVRAPRSETAKTPRLYKSLPYGSQSVFSPLTVIANKGFDHLQANNANRDLRQFDFGAMGVAVDAARRPFDAIEHYPGWSKWLRTEILPMGFNSEDARWAVNYSEHMIAGGLTYRKLAEWFDENGYPAPRVLSAITTFGSSVLNEAAEFQGQRVAASSTVADLFVFDLGGVILFNWDWPVRFFGGTLQASDWSTLASLTFPNGHLQNNGQYYIIKVPLPKTESRLFARFGMGVQGGVSQPIGRDESLSFSLGVDTEVRHVDPVTRDETISMAFSGGLYWDRNNSLLASLTASPTDNRIVLNVFPGVLPGAATNLGVWTAYRKDGQVLFGLVHRRMLGMGLGYGR
jgi:hypothetical protein